MSFRTASAILRGRWLIEPGYVKAHMPLLVRMMRGEVVDFGLEKDESPDPTKVLSNRSASVYRVGRYSDLSRLPDGSIAMVSITGPVMKYGDMCSYGSVDHAHIINRLAVAGNVAGVIIDMDSPGGEAAGTAMLADAIKALGKAKPVLGFIDDGIAASAGAWIISPCHEIYVSQKTDMFGSVGVYQTIADWYGYFEAEGLKVTDIYAPQSTDKNGGYRAFIESGNEDLIKDELKVLAAEFIGTIKANRSGKLTSDEWTTGKMFYAPDAKRIGLIDGVKSFEQVVQRMNTLIKQKAQTSNSNKMSFQKTLVAAKAEQFEVVDGGFLTEEAHLNNIEQKLTDDETTISNQAAKITEQETSIATLTTAKTGLETDLATANATIATKDQEIAALQAKVTELGAKPAAGAAAEEPKEDKFEKAGNKANDFAFQQEIYQMVGR